MPLRPIFVSAALVVGFLVGGSGSMLAADLTHRYGRSHDASGVYDEDYACFAQEPATYKPRIANYREPLCYAARPYGISTHLYDHPRELGGYSAAAGY